MVLSGSTYRLFLDGPENGTMYVRAEYIWTGVTAMTDRLIIESGKGRRRTGRDNFSELDKRRTDEILQDESQKPQQNGGQNNAGTASQTGAAEPDEIVWGNDRTFMNYIDEGHRADLRLFVRIRYMQKVTCSIAYEDITKEPYELDKPIDLMIIDISVGGIGVICENEIDVGSILGIPIILDKIPYDIKCEVVYCIPVDGKFRAGMKIAHKTRAFMRHLKIFVARIALTSTYASGE